MHDLNYNDAFKRREYWPNKVTWLNNRWGNRRIVSRVSVRTESCSVSYWCITNFLKSALVFAPVVKILLRKAYILTIQIQEQKCRKVARMRQEMRIMFKEIISNHWLWLVVFFKQKYLYIYFYIFVFKDCLTKD